MLETTVRFVSVMILLVLVLQPGTAGRSVVPPENQTILSQTEVPVERMENGWKRQVLFSGQLTLVVLDAVGPSADPIQLHSHVHDQISYVIEGRIEAQVGEEVKRIGSGDFFRVPSNVPHGVRILSETAKLVDAFTPPREDFRR